jgi:hypothetical protein
MADSGEIAALQASFRGAAATAADLAALEPQVASLAPEANVDDGFLEELARVTAAHAIASAALRSLVVGMLARRPGGS